METLYQILGLLSAGLIVWFLYRSIKGRPDVFSREKMSQSFGTMGILGLGLILFVACLVLLTRYT